jgi:hypothetical protein
MICSFFTVVTPSDRYEAGQFVPPSEHASEQLLIHNAYHLEPLLPIFGADRRDDQVVVIFKYPITERQRQLVGLEVDGILVGIETTSHLHRVYGNPVYCNEAFIDAPVRTTAQQRVGFGRFFAFAQVALSEFYSLPIFTSLLSRN